MIEIGSVWITKIGKTVVVIVDITLDTVMVRFPSTDAHSFCQERRGTFETYFEEVKYDA